MHFIGAGAILFTAYAWLGGSVAPRDDATIVVDRRAILTFLQYRANAFDDEVFGTALDTMSEAELNDVVEAYIDEEVLYREARSLALDESDNVIRQRLVQKMNFVLADISQPGTTGDEAGLARYFADNIDAYAIDPWVTLTHIFFDADTGGRDEARQRAVSLLRKLDESSADFNDAPAFGDRFPFLTNYVERTLTYLAGHFGAAFAAEIAAMTPSTTDWQGPIESAFGFHLVLLSERAEQSYPELDAVRTRVEQDYANSLSAEIRDDLIDAIRERYRVEILGLRAVTIR